MQASEQFCTEICTGHQGAQEALVRLVVAVVLRLNLFETGRRPNSPPLNTKGKADFPKGVAKAGAKRALK